MADSTEKDMETLRLRVADLYELSGSKPPQKPDLATVTVMATKQFHFLYLR